MAVSIQVEQETGIAIATCTGVLGREEARNGVTALWAHPRWPGQAAVWDFRLARFDISASDVRELAQYVLQGQPERPPTRVAFVTDRDVDYGLSRAFEAFREDPRTNFTVFRDYEEALRWARGAARPEPGLR